MVAIWMVSPLLFFTSGNISSKVLKGMSTMLSALPPRKEPRFSRRPMTRKATPLMMSSWLMGSRWNHSASATSGPTTAVRAAWVTSASAKKRPSALPALLAGA